MREPGSTGADPATVHGGGEWDGVLDHVACLRGQPRTVEVLAGGLTNVNLKVGYPGGTIVVRVAQPGSELLAIDRAAEHLNSRAAARAGVGAPVLEYIGSRSYALYLLHIPASSFEVRYKKLWPRYGALVEARDPQWPWREVLVLFVLSFLMAEVLHRVVERPFMALGRRLIDGWRRRELEGAPEVA